MKCLAKFYNARKRVYMKIGIDIGGSHIAAGIVTQEGKLLTKQEKNISFVEQEKQQIRKQIRDTILSFIDTMLKEKAISILEIETIGIGIPGIIENNKIKRCDKLQIKDWDLSRELQPYYSIPVKLQNDALCAAIAEKEYGRLNKAKRAAFLCLGTGIGGATLIKNQVLPSEYGHMIIKEGGKQCYCGNKGCLETYCSMRVFKNKVLSLLTLDSNLPSEELLLILQQEKQNEKLNQYINEFIDIFAIGISNIINIVNPDKICIGGSFIYFENLFYKKLIEKVKLQSHQFDIPEIVLAKFGNDAGIIGAACIS